MAKAQPTRAAFGDGRAPVIAIVNKATLPLGADLGAMVAALQKFLDTCFVPVWNTPATLKIAKDFLPGGWAIVFLDDADTQGALGYHDLTPEGLPLSKIFVRTTIADGQKVSVTACHELAEMLVDPAVNLWAEDQHGDAWAYETADACEEEEFMIDGVAMSDFVFPAYFESFRKPGSARFDHLGKIHHPLQILPGGYSIVKRGGRVKEVYGSKRKAERFKREDRRGHRSERRK